MSNTQNIKDAVNIVEVIAEHLEIKPAGANYKGLCPFHQEKTPSFMVSQEKQIWHCFGCHKGGDVFTFLQEIEGLEFPEVLKILAKRANITLDVAPMKREETSQKQRLLRIHTLAMRFFMLTLEKSNAAHNARIYAKDRGLTEKEIKNFKLGYAPPSWDALEKFLKKRGFSANEILSSGLVVKKDENSYYDRFRDRLIFPLLDAYGFPIGFGGRSLSQIDSSAKYINSPQTLLYNKSAYLYGLDKAKQAIREKDEAILVEGYMDVISSHKIGVLHVVGTSGTALTDPHLHLLKRYTKNIIFAFDFDRAGLEATLRAIALAWKYECNVKVAKLTDGKDPDSIITENTGAWKAALDSAQHVIDHYLSYLQTKHNRKTAEGKQSIAQELLPIIARLPRRIEQTHYLQKLGDLIGVDSSFLYNEPSFLNSLSPIHPQKNIQTPHEAQPQKPRAYLLRPLTTAVALSLRHPICIPLLKNAVHLLPETSRLKNLYTALVSYYDDQEHFFNKVGFLKSLDETSRALVQRLDLLEDKDYESMDAKSACDEVERLKEHFFARLKQRRKKQLSQKLKAAELNNNEHEVQRILDQLQKLLAEI